MSIEFLVKKLVVFICQKCGDVVEMRIPGEREVSAEKGYCCNARYQVLNRGGDIEIIRLPDKETSKVAIPFDE